MAKIPADKTDLSTQSIQNYGFDKTYKIPLRLGYVYNPLTDKVEPLSAIQGNPSFSYDIVGSVCTISQVIGSDTYQKTIDWSTNPITESEWVII